MKLEKILLESIILAVLAGIIVILLVIALYEYKPNISVAKVETYSKGEETSKVLQEIATTNITDTDGGIIRSYTISAKDLTVYAQSEVYEASRPNPFASLEDDESYKANQSDTGSVGSTNTTNTNTTGYFNKTGKTK